MHFESMHGCLFLNQCLAPPGHRCRKQVLEFLLACVMSAASWATTCTAWLLLESGQAGIPHSNRVHEQNFGALNDADKVRLVATAGAETTAQLWTEDRRALEVDIHKEKTRDHENWEPDLLSQVVCISACGLVWGACPCVHACAATCAGQLCISPAAGRVHALLTIVLSGSCVTYRITRCMLI